MTRSEFLNLITNNIKKYGLHLTSVIESTEPAYIYSIGLNEKFGFEIIFAGGAYFDKEQKSQIINEIVKALDKDLTNMNSVINTHNFGKFKLREAKFSWSKELTLGVFDYYNSNDIKVYQLIPEEKHFTIDIPDMSKERGDNIQLAWQWLTEEWNLPIPKDSKVTTNLEVLKGDPVTEIMKWEENYWEMFSIAADDIKDENIRIVPIGVILGNDVTIENAFALSEKSGIWRDSIHSNWNIWD
ncbi:DUF4262 domain-containing protein [Flammeovirga yaeyamensis]|uniref:DUF4262 domain-containing protein n=1 Tax=Flammeovirga yaeyamensis TaxID=367791 RepID=A0AAX1N293_9BACT|nr:DUF4262 domain-containing protein [Flammeovirga yaeyamensis]MBB3696464.1 hypothetical protein [Flammeovirga yaeyamensis]NMF35142.1 DUF4262 domain-containing protein [Flammeovirga yaeyamensis]QWG00038.1 DUF4262 domain-containing protein [Flammeovirga yaeyamensis]